MEKEETKTCQNCKREIPATNYTIHTVHCARNIKVCPVCKEPVPLSDFDEHHEKLHTLLPCKECGESICGTDLEDHIRDSCAHTMKSCRFCDLDLRRGELPAHERYCGARTEQCKDCGEWVMQRYRQLHIDSNHGFLRLDDDPEPIKKTNVPKPLSMMNWITNGQNGIRVKTHETSGTSKNTNLNCMQREFNSNGPLYSPKSTSTTPAPSTSGAPPTSDIISRQDEARLLRSVENVNLNSGSSNGAIRRSKRTNDQPQVNKAAEAPDKVQKNLWSSQGAVKKRPAPQPPTPRPPSPPPDPRRDLPAACALQRRSQEERRRDEQTAYNLARGLPPVLSPATKLEKLRKMDALQNREVNDQDYKNLLQGRVWMSPEFVSPGHVLGRSDERELEKQRNSLKNYVPMTPEEFGERFKELQLRKEPKEEMVSTGDRFSLIKTSLRELRRGLNEVTAPYNQNTVSDVNTSERERAADGLAGAVAGAGEASDAEAGAEATVVAVADEEVAPCEFCGQLVPLDDLVIHQTGCRPDLAQLKPVGRPPRPRPTPAPTPATPQDPVIPCEFCALSLPVYLITEHQVQCGRQSSLHFVD